MSATEPPVTASAGDDRWAAPHGAPMDGPGGTPSAADPPARDLTRRGRVRKWDRPPPPRDWRWWVGNAGRVLIAAGLMLFGFVAYQLWGTAIETARAQSSLESEFDRLLADVEPIGVDVVESPSPGSAGESDDAGTPVSTETSDEPVSSADGVPDDDTGEAGQSDPGDDEASDGATDDGGGDAPDEGSRPPTVAPADVVPVEDQNLRRVENGDALARIEIPRIGVNDIVVAGVDTGDLKRGPGHFPNTPLPGQLGNSAIAGHRTTYGQPFFDVDRLQVGDEIRVTTPNGLYTYRVTGLRIVDASDYEVVATTDPTRANLTLTSCHPKWTSRQRIIVSSELSSSESSPVGAPVLNYGRPEPAVDDGPVNAPAGDGETDLAGPDTVTSDGSTPDGTTTPDDGVDATIDDSARRDDATVTDSLAATNGSDLDRLGAEATNEEIADAFGEGWFSDPGANLQVGLWGLAVSAIAIAAYLLSRRTRRDWIGGLVGLVPFAVALYFFFQNVNRLLPPNL